MNIYEAYRLTLEQISELEIDGIKVKVVKSKSAFNERLFEKYNTPNNIKPEDWIHVSFIIENQIDLEKVFKSQDKLNNLGIYFDTGFGGGERDWEIDWSLNCK